MTLESKLEQLARDHGATFFGIADLAPAHDEIARQGGEAIASYPRGISLGIGLMHAIVDQLPQRLEERGVRILYRHHAYDFVNQRLDACAAWVASELQAAGYRALPVQASGTVDTDLLQGSISHKLVGHLAGLGWIGKSCLLVTPEAGPRVRWATVLTDAPLNPTGEPLESRCGDCHDCVDACPVDAFTGQRFDPSEPRAARYDAHACKDYFSRMGETMTPAICGMCLWACPYGQAASARLGQGEQT